MVEPNTISVPPTKKTKLHNNNSIEQGCMLWGGEEWRNMLFNQWLGDGAGKMRLGAEDAQRLAESLKASLVADLESGDCGSKKSLDLAGSVIGDVGAAALASALEHGDLSKQRVSLELSSNGIGVAGAEGLANAITLGACVSIDLSFNRIGVKGAEAFATALEQCKQGQKPVLNLRNCNIGPAGATAFAKLFSSGQCPPGLKINLSNNEIGVAGFNELCNALASDKGPHNLILRLSDNGLGVECAGILAAAFKSGPFPPGLTLGLGYNHMGSDGAVLLAETLNSAPKGLGLELNNNGISDQGAMALAKELKSGPQGLELNLCGNKIGGPGAKAIANALRLCTYPRKLALNLSRADIGADGEADMEEAVKVALAGKEDSYGVRISLNTKTVGLCMENDARIDRIKVLNYITLCLQGNNQGFACLPLVILDMIFDRVPGQHLNHDCISEKLSALRVSP